VIDLNSINFIFDEFDFKPDYLNLDSKSINYINDNKYNIIYNLAFENDKDIEFDSTRYLQKIAKKLINYILNIPGIEIIRDNIEIDYNVFDIKDLLDNKPFCIGYENIDIEWLKNILKNLLNVYKGEVKNFDGNIDLYFTQKNNTLVVPSRVFFHMVESPNEDAPFAFMVTYTTIVNDTIKHLPLRSALKEYSKMEDEFRDLTNSLYKIAKESSFIKKLIQSGEIFSPIYLKTDEAYTFLKEIPIYEKNGVVCRIPNWWNQKSSSTTIKIDIEQKCRDGFGFFNLKNLISISPKMVYQGIELTQNEIENLLIDTEGLSLIKGKWIEIDKNKLNNLLKEYEKIKNDGSSFSELVQLSRLNLYGNDDVNVEFTNEDWLQNLINKNINETPEIANVSKDFNGVLRKYQYDGFKWLIGMAQYGFGVCLADDMGLGKTIQILAFLMSYKKYVNKNVLLIVPASLLGNWEREIQKFAPSIDYYIARYINSNPLKISNTFLTITTYQVSQRLNSIYDIEWGIVILDEAQAIKNPETKTAKKIKSIKRDLSIALTGTPIENNLLNLWSIFDFLNPGLLGSESEFRKNYNIKSSNSNNVSSLRKIIKPFILRRLKTDKNIISDLPEKNETILYTELTKKQIILYNKIVSELDDKKISEYNQFTQKRLILTAILQLKQICNHPSQFTGDEEFSLIDSGKFVVLKELCETIFEKREKVLIFTQFTEITKPLNDLLKSVFHKEGFVITGNTSNAQRDKYVNQFQMEDIPYLILSLKAAGVGLNLTSATNVIHFDRWWNPAVENQATDRAYRIGQKKCVNVYKFTTRDTIEEVIASLMKTKSELSDSVLGDIDNNIFSKLSSSELLQAVKYRGDVSE
jgi:non-specific serine/threonine protein kinase